MEKAWLKRRRVRSLGERKELRNGLPPRWCLNPFVKHWVTRAYRALMSTVSQSKAVWQSWGFEYGGNFRSRRSFFSSPPTFVFRTPDSWMMGWYKRLENTFLFILGMQKKFLQRNTKDNNCLALDMQLWARRKRGSNMVAWVLRWQLFCPASEGEENFFTWRTWYEPCGLMMPSPFKTNQSLENVPRFNQHIPQRNGYVRAEWIERSMA